NLGKIIGTIPTWIAAFGFLFGLRRLGARPVATWLCFIGLVAIALGDIEAGLFPLPDPRHESLLLLGFPLWSLSFLVPAPALSASRALRAYVLASLGLATLLIAARIALGEAALLPFAGLFQRAFAAVTVVPIGVAAAALGARFSRGTSRRPPAPGEATATPPT